ncbi:MAG: hypothetical protein JWQ48_4081 [Conexibacter sp.]|nr:hypothetical protein [Conexibacter sp.]
MSRLAALIVVLALAATPAAALALDSNPFLPQGTPQQQPAPAQPAPAPPPSSNGNGGGLGNSGAALLGIAGALVVVGIGLLIARDARKSTPKRRRVHSAITNPDADARRTPGARGRATRAPAKRRKPSPAERRRRKRGRAR